MTDPVQPIRKSFLPSTPPPEWEFSSVFPTGPDDEPGLLLVPGDMGKTVVRRRVSYGGWEPVRPDHWAEEPPSDAGAAVVAPPAPVGLDRRARAAQAIARYDWNAGLSGRVTPSADHYAEAEAVLAELRAELGALLEVRRLCEMTIEGSMRVDAINQARDTLAILDRHMGVKAQQGEA